MAAGGRGRPRPGKRPVSEALEREFRIEPFADYLAFDRGLSDRTVAA